MIEKCHDELQRIEITIIIISFDKKYVTYNMVVFFFEII